MDFEAMIRDAQKNGLTIDDIAKMFSKTLNAVQQEDQKKKAIVDARTELIDQFETAVSKGHLDCTDAAALYTLIMAEKYPDWTAENIKDYFQIIKLNAETTATMVGKEPDELLQALLDKVDNLFDVKNKSDNEKIADFLREIGL
jgi:hypothetical protein